MTWIKTGKRIGDMLADMEFEDRRLERERKTIAAMMRIYCQDHHGRRADLCQTCQEIYEYARVRLRRCRFQGGKPACAKCPVHCYAPQQRATVQEIMRYAGPRMLWRHPILAIRHLLDARRPVPGLPIKPGRF